MHPLKPLSSGIAVSTQIPLSEIANIAAQGYKMIINNRPDGETPDQPASSAVAEAARACGLDYVHIPVIPGKITDDHIKAFKEALAAARGPVVAFCRSGMRSASLWACCACEDLGADAVIHKAAEIGYDLSPLKPRLS